MTVEASSVRTGLGLSSIYPDRKSTRLNSSHANISYAVFCLKKKKGRDVALARLPLTGHAPRCRASRERCVSRPTGAVVTALAPPRLPHRHRRLFFFF